MFTVDVKQQCNNATTMYREDGKWFLYIVFSLQRMAISTNMKNISSSFTKEIFNSIAKKYYDDEILNLKIGACVLDHDDI